MQGDKEQLHGLPISTFYDRSAPSVAKMQTGFMQFIVKPIFSAWCDFVPELREMTMSHLEANQELWIGDTPFIPPEQIYVLTDKTDWDWENGGWR